MLNNNIENLFAKYKKIIVFRKYKKIFVQLNKGKPYMISKFMIEELPYSRLVDKKKCYIRVYNLVNNKKKWGIIDRIGNEVIPPIYDYISPLICGKYFKVFEGDFDWDFHNESADLFDEYIDRSGWNGDYYKRTLGYGRWGLITFQNKIIIPIVYEWIEFIADEHLLCNIGGRRIIKYYDGTLKRKKWAIIDGKWEIRFGSKIIDSSRDLNELMKRFADVEHSKNYPINKQIIGKYSTK